METVNLDHPEFAQLSSEILESGNHLRFTAHGSSMAPFVRDGDVLTVEPVDNTIPQVGDIVFYRTEGDCLITHRIVGITGEGEGIRIRMRGDASPGTEEVISLAQVLGIVTHIQRGDRDFRINHGIWAWSGSLWVGFYPLSFLIFRVLRKVRSIIFGKQLKGQ